MDPCASEYCKSHEHMEKTMERLDALSTELAEGQMTIRENMITLTGIVKDIGTLTARIEKVEENQDELRQFMWKVMGIVGAGTFIVPLVVTMLASKFWIA